MKKVVLVLAAVCSFQAAASVYEVDAVGEFIPSQQRFSQTIDFVELGACETAAINEKAKSILNDGNHENEIYQAVDLEGLGLFSEVTQRCVVFFKRPNGILGRRIEVLGHEVAHCVYGAYHSSKSLIAQGRDIKEVEKQFSQHEAILFFSNLLLSQCADTMTDKNRDILKSIVN